MASAITFDCYIPSLGTREVEGVRALGGVDVGGNLGVDRRVDAIVHEVDVKRGRVSATSLVSLLFPIATSVSLR